MADSKPKKPSESDLVNSELKKAKENADLIWQLIDDELELPEAILNYQGEPLIYENTIVLIQGKAGSHKSRLATSLVSLLLNSDDNLSLLGFSKNGNAECKVLYVDTERNKNYQLPVTIRQIMTDANLTKDELRSCFTILPLNETSRYFRLPVMVRQFVEVNSSAAEGRTSVVVVVDIVSDLSMDFNNLADTNKIADTLNFSANKFNLTYIVILHENPGAEKARGHLGTELNNKASTVLQISETEEKNVIQLKIKKSRMHEKYDEIFLAFDPTVNNLVVIKGKAPAPPKADQEMERFLGVLGDDGFQDIERTELVELLKKKTRWQERKIEELLKKVVENGLPFEAQWGRAYLVKERGKTTKYSKQYSNSDEVDKAEK